MAEEMVVIGVDESRGIDKTAMAVVSIDSAGLMKWIDAWSVEFVDHLDRLRAEFERITGSKMQRVLLGEDAAVQLLSPDAVKLMADTMAEYEAKMIQPFYPVYNYRNPPRSQKHKQRRYKHA